MAWFCINFCYFLIFQEISKTQDGAPATSYDVKWRHNQQRSTSFCRASWGLSVWKFKGPLTDFNKPLLRKIHSHLTASYFVIPERLEGWYFFLVGNTGDDVIGPHKRSRDRFRKNVRAPQVIKLLTFWSLIKFLHYNFYFAVHSFPFISQRLHFKKDLHFCKIHNFLIKAKFHKWNA